MKHRITFEDTSLVPELTMLGYDDTKHAIELKEHKHSGSYEFVYVERGRASWAVGGETFDTKGGEIFITKPDEWHKGSYDIIEPCRFWWLTLQTANQMESFLRLPDEEAATLLARLENLPRIIHLGTAAREPFQMMLHAFQKRPILAALKCRTAIVQLLLLLSSKPNLPQASEEESFELLHQVIDGLPHRLGRSLRVEQLAQEAGMSISYFYKIFQQQTGHSPRDYIEKLKMEEACNQLMDSSHTVTHIALELGYATSQHFSTAFKKLKGRTPLQWRNENQRK